MNSPMALDINTLPLTNPDSVPSVYCNNANIAIAPWDIRLIFSEIVIAGNTEKPVHVLRASIAMNPAHAKALAVSLSAAVAAYETQFGQIMMPEMKPPASAAVAKKP
jgi:hypothetical protein